MNHPHDSDKHMWDLLTTHLEHLQAKQLQHIDTINAIHQAHLRALRETDCYVPYCSSDATNPFLMDYHDAHGRLVDFLWRTCCFKNCQTVEEIAYHLAIGLMRFSYGLTPIIETTVGGEIHVGCEGVVLTTVLPYLHHRLGFTDNHVAWDLRNESLDLLECKCYKYKPTFNQWKLPATLTRTKKSSKKGKKIMAKLAKQ